jgi:hypothetical protein
VPWSFEKGIKTEKEEIPKKIISILRTSASTNFLHKIGLHFPD